MIAWIGKKTNLPKELAEKSKWINLNGNLLLPGLQDSHIHLELTGQKLCSIDLRGTPSIVELKSKVKEYISQNKDLQVINGFGWEQDSFQEKRYPTRKDLDQVESNKPLVLLRNCKKKKKKKYFLSFFFFYFKIIFFFRLSHVRSKLQTNRNVFNKK